MRRLAHLWSDGQTVTNSAIRPVATRSQTNPPATAATKATTIQAAFQVPDVSQLPGRKAPSAPSASQKNIGRRKLSIPIVSIPSTMAARLRTDFMIGFTIGTSVPDRFRPRRADGPGAERAARFYPSVAAKVGAVRWPVACSKA